MDVFAGYETVGCGLVGYEVAGYVVTVGGCGVGDRKGVEAADGSA
jgi:hypothetical protein